MATKSANVTARVQPEVKQKAEAILAELGVPVSVLIDTLYRQIILTGGVPYALTVPKLPTRDTMTDQQFNQIMEIGYQQARAGQGIPLDEALKQMTPAELDAALEKGMDDVRAGRTVPLDEAFAEIQNEI